MYLEIRFEVLVLLLQPRRRLCDQVCLSFVLSVRPSVHDYCKK